MIEFCPDLTVLVARNGQGKTALLDAIALALGLFVDTVAGTSQWRGFRMRDVRRVRDGEAAMTTAKYVEFAVTSETDGHSLSWRRWMRGDAKRAITSKKDAKPLIGMAEHLRSRLDVEIQDDPGEFELPLVCYYGTGRRWDKGVAKPRRLTRSPGNQRCLGYVGSLDGAATYDLFSHWYELTFRSAGEMPVTGVQKANRPERLLAAVNRAVEDVLKPETGWSDLHWDKAERELMLTHPTNGRLPLSFLSDGVRNTIALVADVAHRCARLNPHLGENAAHRTPGILLIDEVDLHLHPEWQQSILNMLRTAFPKLQLIPESVTVFWTFRCE